LERIYLDNAATTRIDPEVLESMMPYLKDDFGNASSIHSFGRSAKVMLEDARDTVAEFIGAAPKEIVFTNSGTESNNFAIKGLAFRHLKSGKNHIITSSIEHLAVLDTLKYLSTEFNFEITYIKPGKNGYINLHDIESAIRPETLLVTVMHSNNETGIINDVKLIAGISSAKGVYSHTDSVQSIGKTQFNVKDLGVNFAAISAHKIYGPKGIAALYIKDKTLLHKLIHGGKQERELRGGTENIASIAGFKKAIELVRKKFESDRKHYFELKQYTFDKLKKNFGDAVIFNSQFENSLPNIINISFDNNKAVYDEEMMLIKLDLKGIALSGGSACTSGTHQPSHVLTELGRDKKTALGSLRISFGRNNKIEELDYLINCLKEIVSLS